MKNELKEQKAYSESLASAYTSVLRGEKLVEASGSQDTQEVSSVGWMLQEWIRQHPDIDTMFIVRKVGLEEFEFVEASGLLQSGEPTELSKQTSGSIAGLFQIRSKKELAEAFAGQTISEPYPTQDKWGYRLRTYTPIWDGQHVAAVLGIGLNGSLLKERLRIERWKGNALLLIPYSVLLALYWVSFRARLERAILSQNQEELRIQQERYRILSDSNSEGMLIHRNGVVVEVNRAFCETFGYTYEEAVGSSVFVFVAPEETEKITEAIKRNFENDIHHIRAICKDGTSLFVELHVKRCSYNGSDTRAVAIRDITEQKRQEQRIYHLAYYDELTGLPNKKRFLRSVSSWLTKSDHNSKAAILFMDLDKFKPINDTFGHKAGDNVMREIAGRLLAELPDDGRLARWGGDEFVVFLPNLGSREEANTAAEAFKSALSRPLVCLGETVVVGASIGISMYPEDGNHEELLVRRADTAMYSGKKIAAKSINFFDSSLQLRADNRIRLQQELRSALEENQLELFYQPQVWMNGGQICGAEALIRWKHPVRGYIPPSEFIPLAEETGMILEIGDWVLKQACLDMKELQEAGLPLIPVSVNLSALQFVKEDLADKIGRVLLATGLHPERLELEITETMMMDPKQASATLHQLKSLGIRISIDDFGTGFSSLHYLNRFPIDKLKIDRSFVTDLDSGDAPITKAIITLAHTLSLDIIAEGVETEDQSRELLRLGCPLAQGFLFYKPLPKEQLFQVLMNYRRPSEEGGA